jgi:hypothetical protein
MAHTMRANFVAGLGLLAGIASCRSEPQKAPRPAWKPAPVALTTAQGREVQPAATWTEHPRPQLVRSAWRSLNGPWQLRAAHASDALPFQTEFEETVLVPFPLESSLSGVGRKVERAFYRRTFEVPADWRGKRVQLHFGAVDWHAAVWVNGVLLGLHDGGYDPFTFDVTDALKVSGPQEVVVDVADPTDAGNQPRGKQVLHPEGIWYTPSTGIWQTVWLEAVPQTHIARLHLRPELAAGRLHIEADVAQARGGDTLEVSASSSGTEIARAQGPAGGSLALAIPAPHAWSPQDPFLYDLRVAIVRGGQVVDEVASYFGLRDLGVERDGQGIPRLELNGEPLVQIGMLDQGFWPDGLYTAPSDAAMCADIELARRLGFNLLRKHVKVEPDRWYYHCDRLGMLVWQDMPSGNNETPRSHEQFERELEAMLRALENHPSIAMWVVFNEGWGQYDTERLTERVSALDPTRWVSNASGWTDAKVGDVVDLHAYPGPACPPVESERAAVLGEFGGLGLGLPGHTWVEKNWGYQGVADSDELTRRYVGLLRQVWKLQRESGLCAAVYTQLSDVETECNGLVTYDRAVVKVDAERVARANRGEFPALHTIAPTSESEAVLWRRAPGRPLDTWTAPDFDDSPWFEAPGGFGVEGTPGAVARTEWKDSEIWLRRHFTWDGQGAGELCALLHHDEDLEVFLNGAPLLEAKGYTTGYELWPLGSHGRELLRTGDNVLAVHCKQTTGGQYVDVGLCFESTP